MPEKQTISRARCDKRQGKAASTQAGEFVREEIEHVRGGKHGARSSKQAIAIGLSKARRAGVKLAPPKKGTSARTRKQAEHDLAAGHEALQPQRVGRGRDRSARVDGELRAAAHRLRQRHVGARPRHCEAPAAAGVRATTSTT